MKYVNHITCRNRHRERLKGAWRSTCLAVLWIASSLVLLAMTAKAQDLGIVAVVNDDVISSLDLQARSELLLKTSGRPDTPEIRQRLRKQVIQLLIDEALKLQEAKRFNIVISQEDIDDAITRIEKSQGKAPGSIKTFIQDNDLSMESFYRQIRGEVAWTKLISRKIRSGITITDEEIYRAQQRMAQGKKVSEVQIAAIILPFTETLEQDETLGLARDIRSQLLGGAEGPELIKKYADRIPLAFGPMTWVARSELHPDIGRVIENLKVGEIAEPVRAPDGYQLIRLLDERTSSTVPENNAEVAVKQIVLKLSEQSMNDEIEAMMNIARDIAKYPGTCTEQGIAGMQDFAGLNIEVNYIRTTLAAMATDVRLLVEPLRVTQITEPFAAPDGIHLLMLCEKITIPTPLPDRDQVREALFREKMELEVEKYLRTVRREAFIDVRG
jgi:peptidyl-prolyl cis-trans isomerase SurA